MAAPTPEEAQKTALLLEAQTKALAFFDEIAATLIAPGKTESQLSKEIHALGEQRHGIKSHWHKRVVRSGPNTLHPYAENPPDRVIGPHDILFVDLGPVFEKWEADFGRTYVLGGDGPGSSSDPEYEKKCRLRDDLEPIWQACKREFDADPDMTGEKLFGIAKTKSAEKGWLYGGPHAGHLIGNFPHERIPNDKVSLYIADGNNQEKMRTRGKDGKMRHWILEIHLVDEEGGWGGFFEQLLTVDS